VVTDGSQVATDRLQVGYRWVTGRLQVVAGKLQVGYR